MGNRHLTKPRSPQRLGRSPAVRRGLRSPMPRSRLGLEGTVVGVVSVAQAGLVALLGGKAVGRSPRRRRSGALSALRGGLYRYSRDLACRGVADGQFACLARSLQLP